MSELQPLRAEHAPAVLNFELANRSYFATYISDRGDDYFDNFPERHSAQIAEQEAGVCRYHVLVDDGGAILGRFNLYDIRDHSANVGYRVAKSIAGRGVASGAVLELCQLAVTKYGLVSLSAAVTLENVASQKVLIKTGFVPDGPAEPGGRAGTWYRRNLTDQ